MKENKQEPYTRPVRTVLGEGSGESNYLTSPYSILLKLLLVRAPHLHRGPLVEKG